MKLKMYQVDAFTTKVFHGNPAAVVPLSEWLNEEEMQAIALENNLAETAFFVPKGDDYSLRWFTPVLEVPLCGHATLASAFVIMNILQPARQNVKFHTKSGELIVTRAGELLQMDFPKREPHVSPVPPELLEGLRKQPKEIVKTASDTNYYAVFETEADIAALQPNLNELQKLHPYGVAVTAPGNSVDFVSRYFVPSYGVPEDPVTGSIHCALIPYWAKKLNKSTLHARQISKRSGDLFCQNLEDRVLISGNAVLYLQGEISF